MNNEPPKKDRLIGSHYNSEGRNAGYDPFAKPGMRSYSASSGHPERYGIHQDEGGSRLFCVEAPQIQVMIGRNLSFSEGDVRKASPGTIFLDGVARCPPLLDLERMVFNLDHHQGCVRAFTLSACEQALLLVLRGIDLKERPWVIYANEPDLDTVLAIWVLLNHIHLSGDRRTQLHKSIIPLVRLEGAIDSHGLELQEFTGFGEGLLEDLRKRLQGLLQEEKMLKEEGKWSESDPLPYTLKVLQKLDGVVFPEDFFQDFHHIEELAKAELADGRIALVCRSERGIYEVESDLKRRYGKRLSLLLLEKTPHHYTVRQVDRFSPLELERAYRKLNDLDPAVSRADSGNRWGGSDEIGGSPRKTGTRLGPYEIADACRLALGKPRRSLHLVRLLAALLLSALPLLGGWFWTRWRAPEFVGLSPIPMEQAMVFLGGATAMTVVLLAWLARRRRHMFGLQWPAGMDWILLLPIALLSSFAGGVWHPLSAPEKGPLALLILAGFSLTAELNFRGTAHGFLVRDYGIQRVGGSWFLSQPALFAALFYAGWTTAAQAAFVSPLEIWWPGWMSSGRFLAAFLFGLVAGLVRERSGSVLVPLLFHFVSAASLWLIMGWLQ